MQRLRVGLPLARPGAWRGGGAALASIVLVLALAGGGATLAAASTGNGPVSVIAANSTGADVVSVGLPGRSTTVEPGFVGVSLEYKTVPAYEGVLPGDVNPVLARLIRNLAPGQTPLVRIGGDSTDWTWWPVPGMRAASGVTNSLTPAWIGSARALALSTGARLILGINLEANSKPIASLEARQLLAGIGRRHVEALELGNEPQLYPILPWYHNPAGLRVYGRPRNYNLGDYGGEFSRIAGALPRIALAGPSIGHTWLSQLGKFVTSVRGVGLVTFHAYGINRYGYAFRGRNCSTPSTDVSHPTVATLLSPLASEGLTRNLVPYIALAHSHALRFRVDEMNAITCAGTPGVSDTFASALWVLNALFAMAHAGVDGVNVHTWRGSAGKLFSFSEDHGHWTSTVRPEYYGLLMFAHAAPTGARLLQTAQTIRGQVQSWATLGRDHATRVLLINDSLTRTSSVLVRAPGTAGRAGLELLQAPSASATAGVTLGGQSFDPATATGMLAGPVPRTVAPLAGHYAVRVSPASAALLTIPPAKRPAPKG